MNINMVIKNILIPSAILLLASCGGSGGSSNNSNNTPVLEYQLKATASEGGTISPSTITVKQGETAHFSVKPDSGFMMTNISGCNGIFKDDIYTVSSVNTSCSIQANFLSLYPPKTTITIRTKNGSTIPEGSFEMDTKEILNLTAMPDVGFRNAQLNFSGGCRKLDERLRDFNIKLYGGSCDISVEFSCRDENIDNVCDRGGSDLIVHHVNISPAVIRLKDIPDTEFTITADLAGDFDEVWVEMWMSTIDHDNHTPKKIKLTQTPDNPYQYFAKLRFDPTEIKNLDSFGGHVGYIGDSYIRASRAGENLFPRNYSGGSVLPKIVIIDSEIPAASLAQQSSGFYANDYLLHVVDPHYHRITDINALSAKVLQKISEPDFLVAIPTGTSPVGDWSYYYPVFNDVSGIGTNIFNSRSGWGANQSLQGYINIGQFGYDFSHFIHEIGHRWGFHLSDEKLRLSDTLCNCHQEWIGTEPSNTAVSQTIIIEQPNGLFILGNPPKEKHFKYSTIEKYLMGIVNAQEVTDTWFLKPGSISESGFKKEELMHINGSVLQQFYGTRLPEARNSPKQFRVSFFTVGPDPLTEAEAAYFSYIAKYQGEDHAAEIQDRIFTYPTFSNATDGAMTIDTKIKILPSAKIDDNQKNILRHENDLLLKSKPHQY